MTRAEFIESFKHELCGLIGEAYTTQLKGAELGFNMRAAFRRVDKILGQAYDEVTAEPPPPPSGATTQGVKK